MDNDWCTQLVAVKNGSFKLKQVVDSFEVEAIRKIMEQIASLKGAMRYAGECSTQIVFPLGNGNTFRIGMTDRDAVGPLGGEDQGNDGVVIWADTYSWRI